MDNQQQIEEIMSFQIPEDFVSEVPKEEVEAFNIQLFESFLDKLVEELLIDLPEEKRDSFIELSESSSVTPQQIIAFLVENVEDAVEKAGVVTLEHKKFVKDFFENN